MRLHTYVHACTHSCTLLSCIYAHTHAKEFNISCALSSESSESESETECGEDEAGSECVSSSSLVPAKPDKPAVPTKDEISQLLSHIRKETEVYLWQ